MKIVKGMLRKERHVTAAGRPAARLYLQSIPDWWKKEWPMIVAHWMLIMSCLQTVRQELPYFLSVIVPGSAHGWERCYPWSLRHCSLCFQYPACRTFPYKGRYVSTMFLAPQGVILKNSPLRDSWQTPSPVGIWHRYFRSAARSVPCHLKIACFQSGIQC